MSVRTTAYAHLDGDVEITVRAPEHPRIHWTIDFDERVTLLTLSRAAVERLRDALTAALDGDER